MKKKMHTTIQLKTSTLERLKYFKEFSKESYDEVINKVMDGQEEGELSEETIRHIKIAMKELKEGKGRPLEEFAAEMGIKI